MVILFRGQLPCTGIGEQTCRGVTKQGGLEEQGVRLIKVLERGMSSLKNSKWLWERERLLQAREVNTATDTENTAETPAFGQAEEEVGAGLHGPGKHNLSRCQKAV